MSIVDQLLGDAAAMDALLAQSWQAPAGPLATALDIAGQRRIVDGHDMLDVTDRGRIWLVLSGGIDLFLVDRHGRFPVAEITAGGLIDAFAPAGPSAKIVGVPVAGTELVETTRAALQALAATPDHAAALAQIWQRWFDVLGRLSPAGTPMPGIIDGAIDGAGFEESCDLLAACALAETLARRAATLQERAAERAAGRTLADRDFEHGLDSVVALVGVTGARDREEAPSIAGAASRVAAALGVPDLSLRRAAVEARPLGEAIAEIALDNRLQFRVITLEGDWWRHDLGPLVAETEAATPCALIRTGKHYMMHAGGVPRIVDKVLARTIAANAYSLYAPLPDGPLTGWRLLGFGLLGRRGDVMAVGFTLLLTGLFSLVTPIATGWLMNPIIPDAERDQVWVIGGLLTLLAIGMTATFLIDTLASLRMETSADNRVQAAIWIRLLNLRLPFFRRFTAGDLANRADGINAIRRMASQSFGTMASGASTAAFSLCLLFYYEWRVTLLVTLACAVFGGAAYLVGRVVLTYNFEGLEVSGRLQGTILQLLDAVAKLRIAGAERPAFLKWLLIYRRSVELNLRQRILANRLLVARSGFGPLVTVLVLVILGIHSGDLFSIFRSAAKPIVRTALMSTGDFVSFNVALGQLVAAAMSLTRAALLLATIRPYYRRVLPILEAPQETVGVGGRIDNLRGDLELRDVRFRYAPDAPLILSGLSMHIPPGKVVALVGPSGGGKSSIVRLLLGFDSPESGDIYIDGTDIRLLDQQELRRQCGVVLQNGRLLAGSIHDNVCAGLPFPPDKVAEALRIAGLEDTVKALPMGVHTNVADGGGAFSGGQRQRLLIARAVIRRPRVLIMDEATSALDNVTQREVVENLRELKCTQLVIAQRLSTIEGADLIHVIDGGRIVESGTYLELMQKKQLFAQLAVRQLL